MIQILLTILLLAIVLGVIYWAIHKVWAAFGLPPLILVLIDVLLVIVAVFYLVQLFGLRGRLGL